MISAAAETSLVDKVFSPETISDAAKQRLNFYYSDTEAFAFIAKVFFRFIRDEREQRLLKNQTGRIDNVTYFGNFCVVFCGMFSGVFFGNCAEIFLGFSVQKVFSFFFVFLNHKNLPIKIEG